MKFITNWLDFDSFIYCTKLAIIQKRNNKQKENRTSIMCQDRCSSRGKDTTKSKVLTLLELTFTLSRGEMGNTQNRTFNIISGNETC